MPTPGYEFVPCQGPEQVPEFCFFKRCMTGKSPFCDSLEECRSLSLPGLHGRIQLVRLKEAEWYWLQQAFVVPTGTQTGTGDTAVSAQPRPLQSKRRSASLYLLISSLPISCPPGFAKARRHDNEPGPGLFLAAEGSFLASRGLS